VSDALSEEFFAEVSDKYYPQVLEGLELLGAGEVQPGIEILARPLHTIKGVTGFMPGFESASSITHKVESFLKKLQASTLPHSADNISLAIYGVNSVFAVIEQIRDQGTPDQSEIDAVCAVLEAASGSGEKAAGSGSANCLRIETTPDRALIIITATRIHRKAQRDQITGAIIGLPQELPIVLDVSGVLTFGTAAWEDLSGLTAYWGISVCGLAGAAKETFYAADMDMRLPIAPPRQAKEETPA
jgi:Chemotaxis protein histidine kinase and related kinases